LPRWISGFLVELSRVHLEGMVVEVDAVDAHPDQLVEIHREQLVEHGETLVTGDEARDVGEVEYTILRVFDDPFPLTDGLLWYPSFSLPRLTLPLLNFSQKVFDPRLESK